MTSLITKDMLEKCYVDTSERYSLRYDYAPSGICILVVKTNNDGITFVLENFVPYPKLDEIGY